MTSGHYLKSELETLIQTDLSIWDFVRSASLDGVWYWDLEKPDNEWMSDEFWRVMGHDPTTKKHDPSEWQHLIHPEDLETAKYNLERHLADPDHPYDQIVRYRRPDGRLTWVRCRGIAIRDEDGRPVRLLGAHNDLTDLMAAQEESTGAYSLLSSVLNATQSGILGLSVDGHVIVANNAARHMLGGIQAPLPFEWPRTIRFLDSETLEPLESSADPLRRLLAGTALSGETTLMSRHKADADPRYVKLTSSKLDNDSSDDITVVLVIEDVSELERNRQQVERHSRLDALGQLTGGIAHDFNNILATIQYSVGLVEQRGADARSAELLETVRASVDRGAQLTRRLLAFAKRQPGLATSTKIGQILRDFEKLTQPVIEEMIDLVISPVEEDLWVYCEVGQLENALLNVVLNSRDVIVRSGHGNRITVSVRGVADVERDPALRLEDTKTFILRGLRAEAGQTDLKDSGSSYRYVEFSVTDNGPGMTEEVRRRAVDPFFTTKESSSGTGLGLSMVYGFVQQAGGELRIYSEEGIGTTVRMLVPRGTLGGAREEPVVSIPEPVGQQQRILVVEDEEALFLTMSAMLETLGYVAIGAATGVEALAMIDKGLKVDLVLTDVVMPGGVSGFDLARHIRDNDPDLPVIFMSGYAGFTDEQIGQVNARLLQKPTPPAELATAIQEALDVDRASLPS